jgi:hypothetical protein
MLTIKTTETVVKTWFINKNVEQPLNMFQRTGGFEFPVILLTRNFELPANKILSKPNLEKKLKIHEN